MEALEEKNQKLIIDKKAKHEVGIILSAVEMHRSHLNSSMKIKNLFKWVWPSEEEFFKRVKMRIITARSVKGVIEEEFKKIEIYITEHKEDLEKFWNILQVLDQDSTYQNREFLWKNWAIGITVNDHESVSVKIEDMRINVPPQVIEVSKIGKSSRTTPNCSERDRRNEGSQMVSRSIPPKLR